MRLIDADELLFAIDEYNKEVHTPNLYLQKVQEAIVEDIKDVIREQITAQPSIRIRVSRAEIMEKLRQAVDRMEEEG